MGESGSGETTSSRALQELFFLADENLPGDAVAAVREAGHDVLWTTTDFAGLADSGVLARVAADRRILLTFDKDFGELVFRGHLPSAGVVLFRTDPASVGALVNLVVTVLQSRTDWAGWFSVVKRGRLRRVPLPDKPLG